MGSMSPSNHFQLQTPNVKLITYSSSPNSCHAILIDENINHVAEVDKLELESFTRRSRELELALKKQDYVSLTAIEAADIERRVDATEFARRVTPSPTITITDNAGGTESVAVSVLPHSYKHIRNLLWIEHHPVYKTALREWRRKEALFASRVERKIQRRLALKNEIYNVLGFYSVFQGVLLTGTSQSNYLHCPNVGLPIALSSFASLCTLVHIWRKFEVISGLQNTIGSEETALKEAKSRILALEDKGEAFRFSDFLENKEKKSSFSPRFHLCGLRSRYLVPLAIFLFSLVFAMSHWLILCHPGHKMRTKFVNGTSSELTLKEANSGIQRFLFKLGKEGQFRSSFEMELDINATYREYHLYVIPSCSAVRIIVSSDHLVDYKVITIKETGGVFSWEGTPRKREEARSSEELTKSLTRWLPKWISILAASCKESIRKDHN